MYKKIILFSLILTTVGSSTVWADTLAKTPMEEKTILIEKSETIKKEIKSIESEKETYDKENDLKEQSILEIKEQKEKLAKEVANLKETIKKEEARIKKEKEEAERKEKERLAEIARQEKEAEEARIAEEKAQAEAQATPQARSVSVASNSSSSPTTSAPTSNYSGQKLTASAGVVQGPSGKETYYNLPMGGVISIAQSIGAEGSYWVREDGVKMYGDYVMIAADLSIRPRGSLVQTSLGMGIVLDTGSFVASNPYQVDIAVTW